MDQSATSTEAFEGLSTFWQVLDLFDQIRNLSQPLSSAAGLEQALSLLVQLANLLGINAAWTARLQSILADPAVFNVVLLIVQQALGSDSSSPSPSPPPIQTQAAVIDEQALSEWLPLITAIIGLIRQIRGAQ